MEWLIDHIFFGKGAGLIPQEVSFVFSVIVIFGLVFLFLQFILRFWRYYWETMRPMMKQDKRRIADEAAQVEKDNQQEEDTKELFRMIVNVHDKIGKMTSDYAGKYATKTDLSKLRDKVEDAREDISNIKGQLGI